MEGDILDIKVQTKDRNYNVYIEHGLMNNLEVLLRHYKEKKIMIISDTNVSDIYLNTIKKILSEFNLFDFIVSSGEKSKSIEKSKEIYKELINNNFGRDSLIISLGGGVIGDLAGFVASTYMRGIDFIQIPTTLLSQVDSSVGGKVAVNFGNIKNIIGNFYQPKMVICDTKTLKTLDKREVKSGLSEGIKYGVIKDINFLKWIKENIYSIKNLEEDKILYLIKKSIVIKKDIVKLDTEDRNIRKILNFGHTIGHGIETLENFNRFNHGEAVAQGILCESFIARELALISDDYYKLIKKTIKEISDTEKFNNKEIDLILEAIKKDKKNTKDKVAFVLPVSEGKVEIFNNIPVDLIIKSLGDGK